MPTGERIWVFEVLGFYDKTASEILREPYETSPVRKSVRIQAKQNRKAQ